MSAFIWTNRDGKRDVLDDPVSMEAEVADIAQEIDRYIDIVDGGDRLLRDTARAGIRNLQRRLEQLHADLTRWNDHAVSATRDEATKLAEQIDRLPSMIGDVTLVVELHSEHSRLMAITAGAPDMAARMLAEPMTATQRRAIEACRSRDAPPAPTRGEAKAWLDLQPRFARGGKVDGGWFAWIDHKGHAHRLNDPLSIEREIAGIAKELSGLRPALTTNVDPAALYAAVDVGGASLSRLSILQGDLDRFDREATAREDTAWTTYAAGWRSKRKAT